jgi:phage-related protein
MHRKHRLFFLLGLLLLFGVFFAYLYYSIKYKPLPPKPPVSACRIPATDSTSFANTFFYDFENVKSSDLLSTEKSLSGTHSVKVKGNNVYSLLLQKPLSELTIQNFTEARISAFMQTDSREKLNGKLMFQIVDKENILKYSYAVNLDEAVVSDKQWFNISGKAVIENYKAEPTDIAKVYYWNNCPQEVFMDDVLIIFGSQQTRGTKPMLDETVDNYKFSAQPNQPPYPTMYAQKISTETFYEADIKKADRNVPFGINTDDKLLRGHFLAGNSKTDQLLLIRRNVPYAFIWFMPEKKMFSFKTIDQGVFPLNLTIVGWFVADVNGDGSDELINLTSNPQSILVYALNNIVGKVKLVSNSRSNIDKGVSQVKKFRLNGKRNECLFVTDITGGVFLLSFEKNAWDIKSLGYMSESANINFDSQIITGHFVKADGNDNVLVLYREKKSGKCFYKLFDIDPLISKNPCIQQGSFGNKCDTLYPENTYFAEDVNGDGIDELISYGHSWRFDLKLISFSEKDYRIMGNIDFKGYEADHNPKYYEDLMISAGRFAVGKTISLFTVCKNHKAVPDLPETIGLYSLPQFKEEPAK